MFERVVDILSGATAQELEEVRTALGAQGIVASVRPYIEKGMFARHKWLRTPNAARKFVLSVRKTDLDKADYLLGRFMRGQK